MSKGNKKAFLETIEKMLSQIDPGNPSIKILVNQIANLPQKQFEEYIKRLRNGVAEHPNLDEPRDIIPIVIPHLAKTKVNARNNIELGKKWGINFFEKIWMHDHTTDTEYLTNIPYAVLSLPIVRQAQTLEKGISYSDSDTRLDTRTGQPVKTNGGAGISGPEIHTLLSQGYRSSVIELVKFRGGDIAAYDQMSKDLMSTGEFSMNSYRENTRARSSDLVAILLKGMHLDTNL